MPRPAGCPERPDGARARGPVFAWVAATGAPYGVSVLSPDTALRCGPLVVVAPIVACSPLFTLFLGRTVFRERQLTLRVALAVVLVSSGVILVRAHR